MNTVAIRCSILLLAGFVMSACGFQLAGNTTLPANLSSIYLSADDLNKQQSDALRQRLTRAGAELVNQADANAVVLTVSVKVLPDRRLVSSASNGKTVDRIARSLNFTVKSATGEILAPAKTLLQQKDILLDDDNLLASNRERASVVEDLEQALFNQLIHQLNRI